MNDLYSLELTAASFAKFTISLQGFEHSPGCKKFESQNFKKIKCIRSYFIFVTYLPREVGGKGISEIYVLVKNMRFFGIVALNSIKTFHSSE